MSISKDEFQDFSEAFKAFLQRSGIKRSVLAKQTGISPGTLKNWTDGTTRNPTQCEQVLWVAAALGLNQSDTEILLKLAGHSSFDRLERPILDIEKSEKAISVIKGRKGESNSEAARPIVIARQSTIAIQDTAIIKTNSRPTAPAPPPHFVGRSRILDRINDELKRKEAIVIIALQGMGGVGKSATALQLAMKLDSYFQGGIFWGRMSEPNGQVRQILKKWSESCGKSLETESNPTADVVRDFIAAYKADRGEVLIIIDDVREAWIEEARNLRQAVPSGVPLLFTTRDETVAVALDAMLIRLDALPLEDASNLLKSHAEASASLVDVEKEAEQLLFEAVDYLPLAIELAGKYLSLRSRKPGLRIFPLVKAIKEKANETLTISTQPGLEAIFSISYDSMQETEKRLFRCLSLFLSSPLQLEHISGVLQQEKYLTEQVLERLVQYSMLQYGREANQYYLHPLLRQYSNHILTESGDKSEGLEQHLRYFVSVITKHSNPTPDEWDILETILPDILQAFRIMVVQERYEDLLAIGTIFCIKSEMLVIRGYHQEEEEILHYMLKASQYLSDIDNQASALSNLSSLAINQNVFRSSEYYGKQAYALYQEKNRSIGIFIVSIDLVLASIDVGETTTAMTYLGQALMSLVDLIAGIHQERPETLAEIDLLDSGVYGTSIKLLERVLTVQIDSEKLNLFLDHLSSMMTPSTKVEFSKYPKFVANANYLQDAFDNTKSTGADGAAAFIHLVVWIIGSDKTHLSSRSKASLAGVAGLLFNSFGFYKQAQEFFEQALYVFDNLQYFRGQSKLLDALATSAERQGLMEKLTEYREQRERLITEAIKRGKQNEV